VFTHGNFPLPPVRMLFFGVVRPLLFASRFTSPPNFSPFPRINLTREWISGFPFVKFAPFKSCFCPRISGSPNNYRGFELVDPPTHLFICTWTQVSSFFVSHMPVFYPNCPVSYSKDIVRVLIRSHMNPLLSRTSPGTNCFFPLSTPTLARPIFRRESY